MYCCVQNLKIKALYLACFVVVCCIDYTLPDLDNASNAYKATWLD